MTRLFTGFDSAWGGRNRGAICNLRIGDDDHELELVDEPVTVSWDEACARLADYTTRDHVIAIDQPLVVPNASGLRPVDRKLAKALMRDYGLGAHAANTSNDACFGPQSGIWSFVESLEREGFEQTPSDVASRVPARRYFECYPHLALIGLFGLKRVLPYKVHHDNLEAWREALRLVRSLEARALAVCNIANFFPTDLPYTKANEDLLDSVISAYVAAHLWFFGTTQNLIIGSLSTGYMVTPADSALRASLEAGFDPIEINPTGRAMSRRPESRLPRISAPDVDRGTPATVGGGESVTLTCTDPGESLGERESVDEVVHRRRPSSNVP